MPKIKSAELDSATSAISKANPVISLTVPSEQQLLAAYLMDLLPETKRRADKAGALLELAIAALDPSNGSRTSKPTKVGQSNISPVVALSYILQDLKPGTGPHLWVTTALQILKGQCGEVTGTS